MAKYNPVEVVIYGRNMVDLRKGAKRIHLNTFATADEAEAFARPVMLALKCDLVHEDAPSQSAADAQAEGMAMDQPAIHKAEPAAEFAQDAASVCVHYHREIKRVPGGQGATWVHADTGAVVGR